MLNFGSQGKQAVLLLIDDDMVSREVTATMLTMNGSQVFTANSGQEALALLKAGQCQPDIILMDAQMPGLNGVELIVALRNCAEVPVYAISASQPPAEVADAADGFLEKPIAFDSLANLLNTRTKGASAHDGVASVLSEPVVNMETLKQLRAMMPIEAVRQIFTVLVGDLHQRIVALERAIGMGDNDAIRKIGHAIKGGCRMVGAMQAGQIGSLFEEGACLASGNQLDDCMALLGDLRAATERLERILKTEFLFRDD